MHHGIVYDTYACKRRELTSASGEESEQAVMHKAAMEMLHHKAENMSHSWNTIVIEG